MAGEARTTAFMLATATVMLGPTSALWDLTVGQHSIGLVKNFTVSAEPTFTDLTQGTTGNLVYSVLTGNPVKASCEVYEYTSRNLTYALGLDGSSLVAFGNEYTLTTAITGNNTTPVTTATFSNATNVAADFPLGSWVAIQHPTIPDAVHYVKLSSAANATGSGPFVHTLTFAGYGFKVFNDMPVGAKIQRVNRLDVGSPAEQPFLSAKIVGVLPEKQEPVTLLIPKLRVMKGFSVAFTSQNFGNMPFEFQPYDLVPTDQFYAEFAQRGPVALFSPT